jgi:hypothetical protein
VPSEVAASIERTAGPVSDGPAAPPRVAAPVPASPSAGLPSWVIALIAGGCGVVLGFVLGRW